jgi:hypothetical protein
MQTPENSDNVPALSHIDEMCRSILHTMSSILCFPESSESMIGIMGRESKLVRRWNCLRRGERM